MQSFLHGSGHSCGGRKDRKDTHHRSTACRGDWSPVPAQSGDLEQVSHYDFYTCLIIALPHFKLREKNGVYLILHCAWQKEYQGMLDEKKIEREMEER